MFFRYLKSENGSDNLKFHANPRVIPFGLGKRKCLGERLAKMSLYKFFSVLIQKYEIVSGQTEPITDERDLGFIKAPLKYKLIFKPRAECKWKLRRLKLQELYILPRIMIYTHFFKDVSFQVSFHTKFGNTFHRCNFNFKVKAYFQTKSWV